MGRKKIIMDEQQMNDLKILDSKRLYEKYGWSRGRVSAYRSNYNIKDFPRMRAAKIPIPPVEEFKHMSIPEIIIKYDVCRGTAIKWLRSKGISQMNKNYKRLETENQFKAKLRLMRMASVFPFLRDAEIARAFNMSRERASQLREKLEIPFMGEKFDNIKFDVVDGG